MESRTAYVETSLGTPGRWAGLADTAYGDLAAGGRRLLLLHGLTFDHRMWEPIAAALPAGQAALALDLHGHGRSPALDCHHMEEVVDALHEAVL